VQEFSSEMLTWDDLRSFLAIARNGNLSAAARMLNVSQTTMGRRLELLHARAGARLLQKTPNGFILTPAGRRVLKNVERMEAEALSIERAIAGEDDKIGGEVRITTVETLGTRVLTPIIKGLVDEHPALSVELMIDRRPLSLSRREADLALRLAEFEQHEIVVRRVAALSFAPYACRDYLASRGRPDFGAGAPGHAVVTVQGDLSMLPDAKRLRELTHAARVVLRTNSREAQLQAVRAGYGIAMLPRVLTRGELDLVELAPLGDRVVRSVWLGVHQDMRNIPRMRFVADRIADALRRSEHMLT